MSLTRVRVLAVVGWLAALAASVADPDAARSAAAQGWHNLPAASLLAARPPRHPFALLIGLNLGPNLFVTGSLAWVLWLRAARAAGARPSIRHATKLGLIAAPLSIAAAVAALSSH